LCIIDKSGVLRQGILGRKIWDNKKEVIENVKDLIETGRKISRFISDIKMTGFSIGTGIFSFSFSFPNFPA
jgi:hypothetical protein